MKRATPYSRALSQRFELERGELLFHDEELGKQLGPEEREDHAAGRLVALQLLLAMADLNEDSPIEPA